MTIRLYSRLYDIARAIWNSIEYRPTSSASEIGFEEVIDKNRFLPYFTNGNKKKKRPCMLIVKTCNYILYIYK